MTLDEEGQILEIAEGAPPSAEALQISGWCLPGLSNLHSHAHQRAIIGLTECAGEGPDSFWTWRQAMYRYQERLTPEDLEAIAAQLYIEMLKGGYTAVGEFHYLHHDQAGQAYSDPAEMSGRLLQAARSVGLPMTLLPVLYAASNFGGAATTEGQKRFSTSAESFLKLLEAAKGHVGDKQTLGIAPHSLRAAPPEVLSDVERAFTQAHPKGPIHIHIAEQVKEVEDCLNWSGKRPVEWLLESYEMSERWCLIHATHLSDRECADLAASGAIVGLCPTTEANLGDGIFPAEAYLKAGGAFGLGSDSHISLDVAEEIRLLEYGQRLITRRRNVLAPAAGASTGQSLFLQAARDGAQAIAQPTGRLEPGRRADLIVLDKDHPNLIGKAREAALDAWVFAAGRSAIRDVYIAGKPAIQDRRHSEERAILERFRKTMERLAS